MIPGTTRLILVRHGQSTFNLAGRMQGCCDEAGLTRAGEQEARLTGRRLAGRAVDRMYCSPLARARQTAGIIAPALGDPELVIDDRLREVDIPAWEGLRGVDLKRDFPREFDAYTNRPEMFSLPGSDRFPWRDLYRRADDFLAHRMPELDGMNALVVSHGGTVRALVHTALNLPITVHGMAQQSNCGISEIGRERPSSPWRLHGLNDTRHLGRFPPKIKSEKSGVRVMLAGEEDAAGLSEWARQFPDTACDRIWIDESCADAGRRILSRAGGPTAVFDCTDRDGVARISAAVQELRAHTDRLSTLGFILRRQDLGGFVRNLPGLRTGLLGQLADAGGAGVVMHYPADQAVPVIQAIWTG